MSAMKFVLLSFPIVDVVNATQSELKEKNLFQHKYFKTIIEL
jgi:hypothetical protein